MSRPAWGWPGRGLGIPSRTFERSGSSRRKAPPPIFYNAAEHTPEALTGIIEALQADGYTIVPVSELLLSGETYIDNAGRQWAK